MVATSDRCYLARRRALETARFAATNHLCVDLFYDGSWRRIEPYSLRRSSAGRLLLHAERSDGTGHRTYGVDKIGGIRATTTPFRPRHSIEFSARGPLHAPLQSRTARSWTTRPSQTWSRTRIGPLHRYQCTRCGKEFRRSKRNAALRAHKDPYGYPAAADEASTWGFSDARRSGVSMWSGS